MKYLIMFLSLVVLSGCATWRDHYNRIYKEYSEQAYWVDSPGGSRSGTACAIAVAGEPRKKCIHELYVRGFAAIRGMYPYADRSRVEDSFTSLRERDHIDLMTVPRIRGLANVDSDLADAYIDLLSYEFYSRQSDASERANAIIREERDQIGAASKAINNLNTQVQMQRLSDEGRVIMVVPYTGY